MRIIIIGAVAAGTSAAAKARRNDETAEIIIYEMDKDISYSGCGLPYYIGGEIDDISELVPRDAAFFKSKYNVDIFTQHIVLGIDSQKQEINIKNLITNKLMTDHYDKLVIAMGASPFIPNIKGNKQENVFTLRNVQDAIRIKRYMQVSSPRNAVILGSGFIGLEMMGNLIKQDIAVTLIEVKDKLTPNLDDDMSVYLEKCLHEKNINIIKSTSVIQILDRRVQLSSNQWIEADMILLATGVKPNIALAQAAGIELGITGALQVNSRMETNIKNIYACGDCIETFSTITGKAVYRPLGSTANKTGRIAGDIITGGNLKYKGNLGTGIFKLFNLTVASTGLSEEEAKENGFDIVVCHNIKPDKPIYYGGKEMVIKAIADKKTSRLLGIQIIGSEGVDKRIDIFATLITYKAKVEELFHLDLAYAPPFSTTKDPVHYTGMILDNAIHHGRALITSQKVNELMDNDGIQVIDARSSSDYEKKGHLEKAINIPHAKIRDYMNKMDKSSPVVTYCNKGVTGNAIQNILINHGFKEVYNLSGGHKFYKATIKKEE